MFIFWKKTLLSDRVYSDPHCIHTGPGRFTLTPVLKEAFRKDGKPRNRTLWRASRGIRSCCIEDSADPTPRVTWWLFFEKDFQQAQVGRDQAEVARLHAYYPRLKEDLAKVIPRPSLAEEALWFCMMSLVQDPRIGESPQQRRARLLSEARRTLDEKNPAVVGERTPLLARPSGEGGEGPARTTSRSSSSRRRKGSSRSAEGDG